MKAKAAKTKAAKRKTAKKKVAKKKVAKKKSSKKKTAKKKVAKKKAAKKATTKKKSSTKKVAKKKASGKKAASKAKQKTKKSATEKSPEPEEPGLPLKEIRARIGLINPQLAELDWLEGLYLYGGELRDADRLERVDFLVVHRGMRAASRIRSAEAQLRELLAAVLPLDFDLKLTGGLTMDLVDNPAAQALLGYTEAVFSR